MDEKEAEARPVMGTIFSSSKYVITTEKNTSCNCCMSICRFSYYIIFYPFK